MPYLQRSLQREGAMNKLIVPAIIVASGIMAATAWSASEQPGSGFQPKPYFEMPLEKDASRVVRLQSVVIPAGVGKPFHRHPGDQCSAVQQITVQVNIEVQSPR